MFVVRRIVAGEGVERKFPLHSPRIEKIEVKRKSVVRRAKLYFLRDRSGKAVSFDRTPWLIGNPFKCAANLLSARALNLIELHRFC